MTKGNAKKKAIPEDRPLQLDYSDMGMYSWEARDENRNLTWYIHSHSNTTNHIRY